MKILFYLLLTTSVVFASIGKITSIKGTVLIERSNQQISAIIGSALEKNDKIITKNSSKALLLFNDKTSITMGKNSSLEVNDYVFDTNVKHKNKAKFKFAKGLFRTITGKIGKLNPDRFKIKVKSATIGIRGSDGTTRKLANGDITHTTNDGEFILTNSKTGKTIVIPKGSTGVLKIEGLKVAPSSKADLDDGSELNNKEKSDKTKVDKSDKKESSKNKDNDNKDEVKENDNKDENTQEVKEDENKEEVIENENKEEAVEDQNTQEVLEDDNVNTQSEFKDSLDEDIEVVDIIDNVSSESQSETDNIEDVNIVEEYIETIVEDEVIENVPELLDTSITNSLIPDTELDNIATNILGSDSYMEYGYFLNSLRENIQTYSLGTLTPEITVETLSNTGTYSGGVAAFVTNTNGDTVSSGGTIDLTFDFLNKNLNGNINITEGNWKASIDNGGITSSGFSSSDISSASTSSVTDITGSLTNGKFYGPDASSVGGDFNLNSSSSGNVNGSFGANTSDVLNLDPSSSINVNLDETLGINEGGI